MGVLFILAFQAEITRFDDKLISKQMLGHHAPYQVLLVPRKPESYFPSTSRPNINKQNF